jgi:hypothetical protein
MKMQKITTSFSGYSDANLEQKAAYILEKMTGNDFFPAPVPTMEDFGASISAYNAALTAAAGLDRVKVALKNEARLSLEILLAKLGMYVMNVALGNVAMLTSSGFTLRKPGDPQYIDNPGNVTIANGVTSGELVVSVAAVKGAKSYLHQLATELPTDATEWVSTSSSRSKFTYTELQPGKQYWLRVAAIGSREQIAYSPVATQFAQ